MDGAIQKVIAYLAVPAPVFAVCLLILVGAAIRYHRHRRVAIVTAVGTGVIVLTFLWYTFGHDIAIMLYPNVGEEGRRYGFQRSVDRGIVPALAVGVGILGLAVFLDRPRPSRSAV